MLLRPCPHIGLRSLALSVACVVIHTPIGAQQTDPSSSVAVLNTAITDPSALAFARCEALAALRGGYDIVVRVRAHATNDGQAKSIRVAAGHLTLLADSAPLTSGLAKLDHKSGRLRIGTKEQAFARGLAFFLADISLFGADSVSFVVHSNPAVSVEDAFTRLEKVIGTFTGETVETRSPFASGPQPMPRHFTITPPLTAGVQAYLGVVTLEPGDVRCLQSNEVALAPP